MTQQQRCIFCVEPTDATVRVRENGHIALQCARCHLIYVSPQPSPDDVLDIYGHDSAHVSARWLIQSEYDKRLHARMTLRTIRRYQRSGELLEIGAGAGFFLDEARKAGFEVVGLELNPRLADYCRDTHGIRCQVELLQDSATSDPFDLIYHCDVLSHFPDPFHEFREMNRRLKDSGYLVFETGNLGELDPKYDHFLSEWQLPDHLFFLTADNIVDLLHRTGFQLVSLKRHGLLTQYRFRQLVERLKRFGTAQPSSGTSPGSEEPREEANAHTADRLPRRPNPLRKAAGRVWYSIPHHLRYGVGRLLPSGATPQTLIVVAKKSTG